MSASETIRHAQRVAAMLDEFIGLLFMARTTGALWEGSATSIRSQRRTPY